MHIRAVGAAALRLHQLYHSGHYDPAHRGENRKGPQGFCQAKSVLFFARHRILDQNGYVLKAATVACGSRPLTPTSVLAWASTVICFRCVLPAGTVICQTRTYCQVAADPTRFPLASR